MTNSKKQIPVNMLVMCALFAALTAVCAQLILPVEPVPITLSLLAVEVCGLLLRKQYAAMAMAVYALMGLVGLPVFSRMGMGPGVLLGPTGGYILGYIPCAFLIALMMEKWGKQVWKQAVALVCGVAVCYAFGTAWFMILTGNTLAVSLAKCVIPFLPGDVVKIVLAIILRRALEIPVRRILRIHRPS